MPRRSKEEARRLFQQRVREALRRADEAFRGGWGAEIEELLSLSRAKIDAITPDEVDLQTYDELIAVVREASRLNISQGELRSRIMALGDIAVKIAKKAPGLAKILV